jgi:hypothetical protein
MASNLLTLRLHMGDSRPKSTTSRQIYVAEKKSFE